MSKNMKASEMRKLNSLNYIGDVDDTWYVVNFDNDFDFDVEANVDVDSDVYYRTLNGMPAILATIEGEKCHLYYKDGKLTGGDLQWYGVEPDGSAALELEGIVPPHTFNEAHNAIGEYRIATYYSGITCQAEASDLLDDNNSYFNYRAFNDDCDVYQELLDRLPEYSEVYSRLLLKRAFDEAKAEASRIKARQAHDLWDSNDTYDIGQEAIMAMRPIISLDVIADLKSDYINDVITLSEVRETIYMLNRSNTVYGLIDHEITLDGFMRTVDACERGVTIFIANHLPDAKRYMLSDIAPYMDDYNHIWKYMRRLTPVNLLELVTT